MAQIKLKNDDKQILINPKADENSRMKARKMDEIIS